MISNKNLKIAIPVAVLIVAGSVGATTLLLTILMGPNSRESASVNSVPVRTEIQSTTVTDEPQYSLPVRLTIPKINVDSDIAYMGLTSSGDMEAPKTNQDSGWYKYGPRPGNTGSAVIAGHLGGR